MVNTNISKKLFIAAAAVGLAVFAAAPASAKTPVKSTGGAKTDDKSAESPYYKLIKIPIPEQIKLECAGLEFMPDGKLAVSTRRGEIYMVENWEGDAPDNVKFTKWASGLIDCLGITYNPKDGFLYCISRGSVVRLKDTDNRGHANVYEDFCDEWGLTGDYHEYAFMSKFDKEGNLWVTLTLTGSFTSDAPFRGWCMKITPDGHAIPTMSGLRSPGGVGFNEKGELFYSENQGPWNGADALRHLEPGMFQGHPIGNKWYDLAPNMGPRVPDPTSNSRIYIEAEKDPKLIPPAIIQPYGKLGQSQSGIVCDMSAGKFGPFEHQMFCGDQHHSNIARFVLQKVGEHYQGVCFPFREGFASGVLPMIQAKDGSLVVGGSNRGWGSTGPKEFALEHLVWTGQTPFEMQDMKLTADGFDLTFTQPLDTASASNPKNYDLATFRYIYQSSYGSPEVDKTTCTIKTATVSEDRKKVHLTVDGLQKGAVHELHVPNLRSADDKPLLHPVAYYSLWQFVGEEKK